MVDERTLYGIDMTFSSFCERADAIVETVLEDNFPALLEQVIRAKYQSKTEKNGDGF
ncbi:MAG: hypothetical protein RSD52_06525 [Oscillospiraceae bacterium]